MNTPPARWRTWLERAAREWPDVPAFDDGRTSVSYAELQRRTAARAAWLREIGVEPGSRIAVLLTPGLAFLELLHAAQQARATIVPLSSRLRSTELARLHVHADPALTLHDAAHAEITAAIGGDRCVAWTATATPPGESSGATSSESGASPEDILTLVYTSGTTGAPKGVLLASANHEAGARASLQRLGCAPGERWLAAMPMSHVGGLSIIVRCALAGMTLVQHERFDAARVDRSLRDDDIQFVSLVPTMLARLLEEANGRPYPSRLRGVVLGGGRLPPALVERAAGLGLPLVATFGMTETAAQATTSRPGDAAAHPGSAGHPNAGVQVRVDAPDERGVGEILVRGEQVFRGYFRDRERTDAVFHGGWLHTGDLGRLDGSGRLWVEVRRTDLVVTGGENVNPEAVEEALLGHPAVIEAGVFGVEDEVWGQRLAAAVVLREATDVTADDVRRWCRERLAGYEVPREIRVVAALPRTVSGKLRRGELSQAFT